MVSVRLEPMTRDEFDAYRVHSEEDYARSFITSGSLPEEEARAKAAEDFARLLPDGFDTPDHHFWTAHDGDLEVGMIWLRIQPTSEGLSAYGFDFAVKEELRRRGYGRAIMEAAAEECRRRGVVSVSLNVFGDNPGAQALYEQMGFEVTSVQMRRLLH